MIQYLKDKLQKRAAKRTFKEYGTQLKSFETSHGTIQYAQWLHPFEQEKFITDANIDFYQNLCKPGTFIIDIGAHTGDTTVPMAIAVGKLGTVLALEPNKYVYKILTTNAELNKEITNIVPACFAATAEDGNFTFNYSDASFCNGGFLTQIKNQKHNHQYELEISGKNLQNYLYENHNELLVDLSLIKIDAEGYDKEILKTIPDIISKYKPNIMVECYTKLNKSEREELFDLVTQFNYSAYRIENFEANAVPIKLSKPNMIDKKHFEILATPNN
jgi:FkbM family methyltransferase